ncbi:MAG: alkylglycerone-phosphate synthase [Sandaracinus sp.]|nr:alkylglycerone-phosphate synthase [Sandaracinus sp.]|tara:strand:+ start:2158 stop:3819 length:1662 start_codon:yes stop_codon:yes gene_type:complete
MPHSREELRWNGWGLRSQGFDLKGNDAAVWDFVRRTIGLAELPATPPVPLAQVDLPESRLDESLVDALRASLGAAKVKLGDYERAFHAMGRSYADLVRLRAGELGDTVPDAVVYPETEAEVADVLAQCAAAGVAVVPFGGGSSVVGGVEAQKAADQTGVVTLDTTLMAKLLDLDPVSHTATFQAGIYGPDLEAELQRRGFTLGHYPQSFEFSTLGGWIAARGAGQQSNRYGCADEWTVGVRLITPEGEWRTLPFPHSAAGPDLNELVAGSEGTLGVITEATVRIHELPAKRDYRAYLFKSFEAGVAAVRRIVQAEIPVAMMRLSDPDESHFFGSFKGLLKPPGTVESAGEKALAAAGYGDGRAVLMIGLEGDPLDVRHSLARTMAAAVREGGLPVGTGPGKAWYEQRFAMPYLRDPMLDRGVGIDTLETSTQWSKVPTLYAAVRRAIRSSLGPDAAILTHVSHSYTDGCSLYFTFFFARDLEDPMGQWRQVKRAASDAIAESGGTISHHHGVGTDHAEWFRPEKGPLAIEMLRAAKERLDPANILNPGKLFER